MVKCGSIAGQCQAVGKANLHNQKCLPVDGVEKCTLSAIYWYRRRPSKTVLSESDFEPEEVTRPLTGDDVQSSLTRSVLKEICLKRTDSYLLSESFKVISLNNGIIPSHFHFLRQKFISVIFS